MTGSYYLAVDVGMTRTAAATARLTSDGSLLAAPFALGRHSDSAPSAFLPTDGELLFGDAAQRRGIAEPERLVRDYKRRIGDEVPIIAGGQRFTPEGVLALTVAWVVDLVAEREGRYPGAIAVTVPFGWGAYRLQLVQDALARHGWASVTLVSESEAAARHYEAANPLAPGRALAIYHLGGATFDAIVLHKDAEGALQVAGAPAGLADIGGVDFDDAVLRHTLAVAGVRADALGDTRAERMALAALRRECVDAKESLSFDSETVVPMFVGGRQSTVRLTRSELEAMIESRLERTVGALADALESARVSSADLDAILLTGGSSRIPRVAEVLSERFDRPIAIDADPKAVVALGAVRVLCDLAAPGAATAADVLAVEPEELEERRDAGGAPVPSRPRRWGRRTAVAAVSGGSLVLALGMVVASATPVADGLRADADRGSLLGQMLWAGLGAGSARAAEPGFLETRTVTPAEEAAPSRGGEQAQPQTRRALRRVGAARSDTVTARAPLPVRADELPHGHAPAVPRASDPAPTPSTPAAPAAGPTVDPPPGPANAAPEPADPVPEPAAAEPAPAADPTDDAGSGPTPETADDPTADDSTADDDSAAAEPAPDDPTAEAPPADEPTAQTASAPGPGSASTPDEPGQAAPAPSDQEPAASGDTAASEHAEAPAQS